MFTKIYTKTFYAVYFLLLAVYLIIVGSVIVYGTSARAMMDRRQYQVPPYNTQENKAMTEYLKHLFSKKKKNNNDAKHERPKGQRKEK
jgi:hypothetical protein